MAEFPTYEQMAKNVAEKALDEFLYDGKSIREWMKIIAEQEPKTGHWIETDEKDGAFFICDKCHRQSDIMENYCPNCGAKMFESQESEEQTE